MKNLGLILTVALSVFSSSIYGESVKDYFDEETEEETEISEGPEIPDSLIYGPKLFDLEDMVQDFVLETKRIEVPGFPDIFNPSIIEWDGSLLLSFRIYSPNGSAGQIGLVRLDENGNQIGPGQILDIPFTDAYCHAKRQDPRLISFNHRLYIVYNNHLKTIINREIRRMLVAEILSDGQSFYVEKSDIFMNFEGESPTRNEKNWVPFSYRDQLMLAYSINPHKIFRPMLGTEFCESFSTSEAKMKWDWGALRGGTPALKIGDQYLAFFHSSKNLPTVHSDGKTILHYFMGAYTFSSEPPFEIQAISPEPIVGKRFYHGPACKTWKPQRVVFPCGFVLLGDTAWVSYGRQDHEVWLVKIDVKKLLESLVPVEPNK